MIENLGRRLVERGFPPLKFPALEEADPAMLACVRGRWPAHGYVRGWGLEHGDLAQRIAEHPLYVQALEATQGRSIMVEHRLMNLFLIIACFFDTLDDHNIVEFGSYRGGSALFMAFLLKQLYPEASFFAYDTFEGMPSVDIAVDRHIEGDFPDTDLGGLYLARAAANLDRLHLIPGRVEETFPAFIPPDMRFGLAHFDMDIYEPTVFAQDAVWTRMTRNGYYVYDDATTSGCLGVTQAAEELILARRLHSEQIYPHLVFRVGGEPGR